MKRYTRMEGIDFHETFAPVAKLVVVRCIWLLLLNATRLRTSYMWTIPLFMEIWERRSTCVFYKNFRKMTVVVSINWKNHFMGLRQASRNWYHKFTEALVNIGFKESQAYHSLFVYHHEGIYVSALIYYQVKSSDPQKVSMWKHNQNKLEIHAISTNGIFFQQTSVTPTAVMPKSRGVVVISRIFEKKKEN